MRILILSFHFPPDISAGSFRTEALVKALISNLVEPISIDVLTTLPNRYPKFVIDADSFEQSENSKIYRLKLDSHNGRILRQSFNFVKYANFVLKKTKHKEYDVIFATSSKLMTAVLGAYLSKKMNTPLYLDIRDLFVDTIKDVYPGWKQWFLQPIFSNLELWAYNAATHINIVSEGFIEYINTKTKIKNISVHTNGVDDLFLSYKHSHQLLKNNIDQSNIAQKHITILYAGNIGEGQAIDTIIPAMSKRLGKNYIFKIIGDGGRMSELKNNISKAAITNIELYPPAERKKLLSEYYGADILFLHLNDHKAFYKVLPSKLFEYAATGKPILAGVSGFSAKFIKDNIQNCEVFEPCNVEQALNALKRLHLSYQNRQEFIQRFQRKEIMQRMCFEVINLAIKKNK